MLHWSQVSDTKKEKKIFLYFSFSPMSSNSFLLILPLSSHVKESKKKKKKGEWSRASLIVGLSSYISKQFLCLNDICKLRKETGNLTKTGWKRHENSQSHWHPFPMWTLVKRNKTLISHTKQSLPHGKNSEVVFLYLKQISFSGVPLKSRQT